jgi:hypothetical protein
MSGPRRTYDVLRGYVNREWERIQGVDDMSDAVRELDDLTPAARRPASAVDESGGRIRSTTMSQEEIARQVLGVPPGASFAEIRASFDRIVKRTDPANFPAGSQEASQATEIHRRVHRAYTILTEEMDATEKRFRTLEIE